MKHLKRMLAICLAAGLGCSMVTGCTDSGKNNVDKEKATVDIFQFKVEVNDALKTATQTYMKEHKNVTINLETVGGGDDYGAALRTKMSSSDQPEIFNVGGPPDIVDWKKNLEDLSDQEWIGKVAEGLLDDVSDNGKVYGLPMSVEGYGFLYNKDIFEAAGIDGESLKTYQEIDQAFGKLQEMIEDGKLKDEFPVLEAVMEYPVKETWVTGMHTANVSLGQEFSSATEAFESESIDFKYGDQLKDLIDLQVKYTSSAKTPSNLNAVDYSMQVGGGYAIERVAVIQQGNWVYPEIKNVDEEVAQHTGMIPIPLKGVSEGNIPVGVPIYWSVNSGSSDTDKQAAKDFLNWLYQSEEGKKIVVDDLGFIPPFTNYGDLAPSDPLSKIVAQHVKDGTIAPWVWTGAPTGWAQESLGVNIQSYVAGEKSWDEVVRESKADWEKARK